MLKHKHLFPIVASSIFTILFLLHIFNLPITIDSTSIILAVLCLTPWLVKYIKSVEVTGVGKLELQEINVNLSSLRGVLETTPMFMYTKLHEEGKRLYLSAVDNEVKLSDYLSKRNLEGRSGEIDKQIQVLIGYGWILESDGVIKATEKGRRDFFTFGDFVYSRIAPAGFFGSKKDNPG